MAYLPIEDHGIIGDTRTVALVGRDGSIDWFCFPDLDSPSVFAAILDDGKGGRFQIAPERGDDTVHKQIYWPDTNVLVTRFLSADGVGQVIDFMPVGKRLGHRAGPLIIRRVQVVRGTMAFLLHCEPAFNYAQDDHRLEATPNGIRFVTQTVNLELYSERPLTTAGRAAQARFVLHEGEAVSFVFGAAGRANEVPWSETAAGETMDQTIRFWRAWLERCTYRGRWREMVHRSALVLKLLTYGPTGAIVAAPTCSLPAPIGGARNWDYRYAWVRDAAFTLYALMRIGFTEEAAHFMEWIEARCHEIQPDGSLQIVYGIDGRHDLREEELPHLEGYRGSKPVRIGNGAFDQLQLDIYGELMDSVYLHNKHVAPISYDLWRYLRRLTNWVCDNWQRPDQGIWEVRSGPQHFVYSKLMCWVALDRAVRLADKRSFPADRDHWIQMRDRIYEEVMTRGWNPAKWSFVQHYDSDTLDAANLMLPLVFFLAPNDPRMVATLGATMKRPAEGGLLSNSLVYRYNLHETEDGLEGEEGSFNICTFWLVEALTRAGRTNPAALERARVIFESMLGYANHLGLYAEGIGKRGEALGNFPQAFTHLSLISAAFNLDRALGGHE